MIRSVQDGCCEWCGATEDLVEAELGEPRLTILVCNNARECESRWPAQFPPGTIGAPASNEEKLREALAWAIGWIEHCSENPLEDEEPEDYEARYAALALLRGKRSPFETHAGRCISCGTETSVGGIECERCAEAPDPQEMP